MKVIIQEEIKEGHFKRPHVSLSDDEFDYPYYGYVTIVIQEGNNATEVTINARDLQRSLLPFLDRAADEQEHSNS